MGYYVKHTKQVKLGVRRADRPTQGRTGPTGLNRYSPHPPSRAGLKRRLSCHTSQTSRVEGHSGYSSFCCCRCYSCCYCCLLLFLSCSSSVELRRLHEEMRKAGRKRQQDTKNAAQYVFSAGRAWRPDTVPPRLESTSPSTGQDNSRELLLAMVGSEVAYEGVLQSGVTPSSVNRKILHGCSKLFSGVSLEGFQWFLRRD